MAHNSQDDSNITVSKVYETLKSGPFLKNLYWDVLSDIKEKSTFKQMRDTIEKLIKGKLDSLSDVSVTEPDNLQLKTLVAEICSMTYAIDTVYSKILYIKLRKEFLSHVIDSIKDLRKERRISDLQWAELANDQYLKNCAEISALNAPQQKPVETSSRPVRLKCPRMTPNDIATKNRELQSEIHKDLKAINSESKRTESTKNSKASIQAVTAKKQTSAPNKKVSKKQKTQESQMSSKPSSVSLKEAKNVKDTSNKDILVSKPESDAESDISVGHESLASVSSVHTSDLSSFDDQISLSSEDETNGSKKRLSLKELKNICNNGQASDKLSNLVLNDISGFLQSSSSKKKNAAEIFKEEIEATSKKNTKDAISSNYSPVKDDKAQDSADSSSESKSPSVKTLPKRIRKPNSKYSSENILCTISRVKDRKKQSIPAENTKEQQNNKKRANEDLSDSDDEKPAKIMKTSLVKETTSDLSDTPKQSIEVNKPQFAIRPLSSRRIAPVTLYST